jgi:hypothetical protein
MRHHIHPLRDTARELTLVNTAANSSRASQRSSPAQPALRDTAATLLEKHDTQPAWRFDRCSTNVAVTKLTNSQITALYFHFTEET